MIAIINRTRIIDWKIGLKPNSGYKGFTWKLWKIQRAIEYDNLIYTFKFYDLNGEQYAIKYIQTELDDNTTPNNLAKLIIDYWEEFSYDS